MTYRGKVKGGLIVLEKNAHLEDGTDVRVEPLFRGTTRLSKRLLKHAGKATGLPHDAARNHEHYLYGTAKR